MTAYLIFLWTTKLEAHQVVERTPLVKIFAFMLKSIYSWGAKCNNKESVYKYVEPW